MTPEGTQGAQGTPKWVAPEPSPVLNPLRAHLRNPSAVIYLGPGWWALALRCHEAVAAEFPDYELLDVKQKWAALAFQANPHPSTGHGAGGSRDEYSRLHRVTTEFNRISRTVCENCGRPGSHRTTRRLQLTLCDTCEATTPARGLW